MAADGGGLRGIGQRTTEAPSMTGSSSSAYRNFIHSLRSPKTRLEYLRSLRYYMDWLKMDVDNDYDKLLQKDPKLIASDIIDFIIYLKDHKKLAPASVSSHIAALRHFYDFNDIDLKWKKINSFKGEYYNVTEDRPYSREEIKLLADRAELRNRAIILLMASSGLRVGAIPELKIKDLLPIDTKQHGGLYQVTVYKRSKSKYITFCTPEARKVIDQYLEWRRSVGENLNPEAPLFRKTFNRNDLLQSRNPQPLSLGTLSWILNILLHSTSVRTTQHLTEQKEGRNDSNTSITPLLTSSQQQTPPHRRETMQAHGFRKFFDTSCTNAGVNPIYTEFLMGHSLGLKSRYSKPTPLDLLEGNDKNLGYISAINALTIDVSNRLRTKVKTLESEASKIDQLQGQVLRLGMMVNKLIGGVSKVAANKEQVAAVIDELYPPEKYSYEHYKKSQAQSNQQKQQ
jgi:site-specific recombinase XerD